jgi:hypothetical protein
MSHIFPSSPHPLNPFAGLEAHNPTPFERQQLADFETALDLISSGHMDDQTIELLTRSSEHLRNMAKERSYYESHKIKREISPMLDDS